jgi:hypothetical protein
MRDAKKRSVDEVRGVMDEVSCWELSINNATQLRGEI